ncbi:hypothetical protein [Streptomyces sp. NPDC048623]|uniref:hypothetical protein n=1 Tax=Streptomyces sp. NPDC048623 TaxID=3155761 RepID=UPI00341DD885
MRGLRPGGSGREQAAGGAAVAGLAAFGLLVAGCSTGGTGSRDEGAARPDQVASTVPATPSPSVPGGEDTPARAAKRVDPIALIKNDPKVGARLKADLKPCTADAYPVDTSYGNLTNSASPDVVVNVMTCGDAVGLGTFVYREENNAYTNVFVAEDAAVYGTIDRGDLIVTKQVYAKGDPVAYPSGEDVITYRWSGNRFTQHDWVHNEYSKAVGDGIADGAAAPTEPPAG